MKANPALPATGKRTSRSLYALVLLLCVAIMAAIGYHSLSFGVWQYRNPKANAMTFYSHYWDALTWKKLPEFQ